MRCDAVADDGMRCALMPHPQAKDQHVFTTGDFVVGASSSGNAKEAVDGGRRWSEWIHMVHTARGILTGVPAPNPGHGTLNVEQVAALTEVAAALGMVVRPGPDGDPVYQMEEW